MVNKVKENKYINNVVYPLVLLLLSIVNINQGIDISDATYSLSNYMFVDKVYGTWALSTYLSNQVGYIIVRLPYGNCLIGANFYTGLILAAIALFMFFMLKDDIGCPKLFIAEFIAISFCWIPTTILYNYLSYLLMAVGALTLYKGIERKQVRFLFLAGVILGINVFVRIPNITQALFIVVVWTEGLLNKDELNSIIKRTFICVAGYLVGMVAVLIHIVTRYSLNNIFEMINGLRNMSSSDDTYSVYSMISDTYMAYMHSLKWIVIFCVVFIGGLFLYNIKKNKYEKIKTIFYSVILLVMYRFLWGKGMFSFRYFEDYSSMYEWGMIVLFVSIAVDVFVLFSSRYEKKIKSLACLSLVTIIIAPLGSNNYTFQNLNNLFLVMPVTIYVFYDIVHQFRSSNYRIPIMMFCGSLLLLIIVQSFGFHMHFSFRDGVRGEKRDTKIQGIESLNGIYTNFDRAKSLLTINEYVIEEKIESAIFFGDCPGLSYVFKIESAISTTWPDLDSYKIEDFEKEVDECVLPIIIRKNILLSDDAEIKYDYLMNHIMVNGYNCEFENEDYSVFIRKG